MKDNIEIKVSLHETLEIIEKVSDRLGLHVNKKLHNSIKNNDNNVYSYLDEFNQIKEFNDILNKGFNNLGPTAFKKKLTEIEDFTGYNYDHELDFGSVDRMIIFMQDLCQLVFVIQGKHEVKYVD